jgi:trehalose 6-phosphate phosphatase
LRGSSLFLDLDGTLVEIADRPDAVVIQPELRRLLQNATERLRGRVAIISGRPVDQIKTLLGDLRFPIGGSHGLELAWPDGRRNAPARPTAFDQALSEMAQLRRRHPGILIEDKPLGVALHYRNAPAAERECRELAERLADVSGLPVQFGKMVLELKAHEGGKGDALRAFMADPDMSRTRPVFLGDDLTDEHGFLAAADLGGAGVLVGERRETAASYQLAGVRDVLCWLDEAVSNL